MANPENVLSESGQPRKTPHCMTPFVRAGKGRTVVTATESNGRRDEGQEREGLLTKDKSRTLGPQTVFYVLWQCSHKYTQLPEVIQLYTWNECYFM